MGVQGIQVPHVSDPATAREAVKAVRYPPEGDRGMAAAAAPPDYGKIPLPRTMASSNREILLACMIEDMAAVERDRRDRRGRGGRLLAVGRGFVALRSGQAASPITRGSSRRSTGCARRS